MTSPNERPDVPPLPPAGPEPAGPGAAGPEPADVPPAQPAPAGPPATGAPGVPAAMGAPGVPAAMGADLRATLEDSARAFDQRAQSLGREAEAAARRWGENPAVKETAELAGRLWGLVLLGFGLWFFADVTLKLDLPSVRWSELWPVVLIVLGGFVVLRGLARRS